MIGLFFIFLALLGVYLLIKSQFRNFKLGWVITGLIAATVCLVIANALIRGFRGTGVNQRWLTQQVGNAFNHAILRDDWQDDEHHPLLNNNWQNNAMIQAIILDSQNNYKPKLNVQDVLKKLQKPETPIDGECGVCYDTLDDNILACPKCSQCTHFDCLKSWLESGQRNCIYCRQDLV